jgi:hypothetical protein
MQANRAIGAYAGPLNGGLHQVDGGSIANVFVQPGYSGSAVCESEQYLVYGMMVGKYEGAALAAYFRGTSQIVKAVPGLATTSMVSKPFSIAPIVPDARRAGVRTDAITQFCVHCANTVKTSFPNNNISALRHAWEPDYADERFFYIGDRSALLNTRAQPCSGEFALSYELFFAGDRLGDGVAFEVALMWDADYDQNLFGTFWADSRMDRYQQILESRLRQVLQVDFVRIGADRNLEIGFRRMLTPQSDRKGLKDEAAGLGGASAAADIIRLKQLCETLVTNEILTIAGPSWSS